MRVNMNQKKNKLIVILIIIVSIIIVLSGIGIVYVATDLFKSNKNLFIKYVTQISNKEDGFINNDLKTYLAQKKEKAYTNKSDFKVTANSSSDNQKLENVNKFTITSEGKIDNPNQKSEQNISINYSNDVKLPFIYKSIENEYGIKSDYLSPKYIVFNRDNTNVIENKQKNSQNEIQNSSNIGSTIENLMKNPFSEEDMNRIKNNYSVIINQISEDKFSKLSDSNGTGYKLELVGDDIKNTLIQILETLSNDEETLNKINEYLKAQKNSIKITKKQIEEAITNLTNNINMQNESFCIIVYKDGGKTKKIVISTNNFNLDIQKLSDKNKAEYDIAMNSIYNDENMKITIKVVFEGLNLNEEIKENYQLGIENSENTYVYEIANNVQFTSEANMEEFTSDNSLILSQYEPEAVTSFLEQVNQRIKEVNAMHISKLGISENENPVYYLVPSLGSYSELIKNINGSKVSEEDVNTFNKKFEVYQSTNLQGVTVKGLLTTIGLNNENTENRQIKEINFNGEEYEASIQNIAFIKEDIKTDAYYRVEFEKDQETGIIYRAVINPK